MDAGLIVFIAIGGAVFALIALAVRRMARAKDYGEDDAPDATPAQDKRSKAEARRAEKKEREAKRRAERKRRAAKPKPDDAEDDDAAPSDPGEEQARLSKGLAKTRGGFIARLGKLFSKPDLDEDLLQEIEEVLFTADIGVRTTQMLIESIRDKLDRKQLQNAEAIWAHLREQATTMLRHAHVPPIDFARTRPFVLLVIGVNGTGKTTTIGKLASRLKADGHKVMLAAGDTFRAAAVQQLEVWGDRSDVPVIAGKEGADPSSVIVSAMKQAKEEDVDVIICDTAGRLQTKVLLMEELQKIGRNIAKHVPGAPHETFLVLDSTTGQNAIVQATKFKEAMDITGIVLTKLDGTAKGGVLLGISNEMELPVRYVGIGEQIDDLRVFDPDAFIAALFEREDAEAIENH